MKTTCIKLAAKVSRYTPDITPTIHKMLEGFEKEYRLQLDDAIKILAHAVIISAILTATSAKDESTWASLCQKPLEFCRRSLQIPDSSFNQTLLFKISPSATSKSAKKHKKDSDTSSVSTTASGSSSSTASSSSTTTSIGPLAAFSKTLNKKNVRTFGKKEVVSL
jgi:hypothetical protein